MQKFILHTGIVLPLLSDNIDTDQIIPSREMKKVSKLGLAEGLFSGQRYLYEGKEKKGINPNFILNQPPYDKSTILISNKNFGCGSSREHAVWALVEYGFRAIIAQSFGSIFRNNCIRNGLLPIVLSPEDIHSINQSLEQDTSLSIDLEARQVICINGDKFEFELEDYSQQMLLNGWDFIDLTLQFNDKIDSFAESDRQVRPWAYLPV
ncbi:3-isopropylmalate dehydratase small subunit [Paraglaciecola sp. 2405UD69-4]|uniref:3-isopropylmalate dehydratase small subunit n=1 Tax=Paraglaciecola sp. 2405UD69-4 TaxID=3391836 RepID=UPI0039C9766B